MNFQSQYAKINGKNINIHDFMKETDIPFCIQHNHPLIAVQGSYNRWHFRHKCQNDVCKFNPMTLWHAEWQGNFENTEIHFHKLKNQIKERRADIVENNYVIEIQHSLIDSQDVIDRNSDYALHNKKVLWIIDGNKNIHIKDGLMEFIDHWKYESFMTCENIFIDIKGDIYKVCPNEVKSHMIHTSIPILKPYFINLLKTNIDSWETPILHQCKLFIRQAGAGNGKSYQIN